MAISQQARDAIWFEQGWDVDGARVWQSMYEQSGDDFDDEDSERFLAEYAMAWRDATSSVSSAVDWIFAFDDDLEGAHPWMATSLHADDAGELASAGVTPEEFVKSWSVTGLPPERVALAVRAGLSVQDAQAVPNTPEGWAAVDLLAGMRHAG